MECRKCPYFEKRKNEFTGSVVVKGFCKLRHKLISEETIGMQFCKDRAVVSPDKSRPAASSEDDFVKRAAFG